MSMANDTYINADGLQGRWGISLVVPTVTRRFNFPLPLSCSLSWIGAEDGLDDRVSPQAPGNIISL